MTEKSRAREVWVFLVLAGALLYAGFGPASREVVQAIGLVAGIVGFGFGVLEAKAGDWRSMISFAVGLYGLFLVFGG